MSGTLSRRLANLEASFAPRMARSGRLVFLLVRKGREEEDRVLAYRNAGIEPEEGDRCLLRVLVSPDPRDRMDDLRPRASVLTPLKTIRGNRHGR